jgi:hypothetical protein
MKSKIDEINWVEELYVINRGDCGIWGWDWLTLLTRALGMIVTQCVAYWIEYSSKKNHRVEWGELSRGNIEMVDVMASSGSGAGMRK